MHCIRSNMCDYWQKDLYSRCSLTSTWQQMMSCTCFSFFLSFVFLQVSVDAVRELDRKLFDAYIERRADPIAGSLEPGMYAGYFDWRDCRTPTGTQCWGGESPSATTNWPQWAHEFSPSSPVGQKHDISGLICIVVVPMCHVRSTTLWLLTVNPAKDILSVPLQCSLGLYGELWVCSCVCVCIHLTFCYEPRWNLNMMFTLAQDVKQHVKSWRESSY